MHKTVSSGDYSFDAKRDGKYVYCFSNEHWSANSKEVSFNVHGIVYVPESDAPSDPLEAEGWSSSFNDSVQCLTRCKCDHFLSFFPKSRMNNHTLWCVSAHIEIQLKAQMRESNGGRFSNWEY